MRIFWSIIAIFAVLTGGVYLWNRRAAPAPSPVAMTTPAPRSVPVPLPSPTPAPAREPDAAPPPVPDAAPLPEPAIESIPELVATAQPEPQPDPAPDLGPAPPSDPTPDQPPAATLSPGTAVAPIPPEFQDAAALVADLIASAEAREAAPDEPIDTRTDKETVEPDPAAPAEPSPDITPGAPAAVTTLDDGSMLLDDRYEVSGRGTREDPYRVKWDLLISASATYMPREGKKEIPDRIGMFDGKWVKITGYIAFPLAARQAEEALLMLNQWDGCCIGVPPSPYDGIEVMLREPVSFERRHRAVYGTIEGVLKVDPYLVNNWLVGLYIMEDAEMEMGF